MIARNTSLITYKVIFSKGNLKKKNLIYEYTFLWLKWRFGNISSRCGLNCRIIQSWEKIPHCSTYNYLWEGYKVATLFSIDPQVLYRWKIFLSSWSIHSLNIFLARLLVGYSYPVKVGVLTIKLQNRGLHHQMVLHERARYVLYVSVATNHVENTCRSA